MFRPLELFIGLRYTRAKRRNHFVSFISLISMLGITLGVTALITVLSVMNGFEKELRHRILGVASHATVTGIDQTLAYWYWQPLRQQLDEYPRVEGSAPFIRGEGMLSFAGQVSGSVIRGIEPEYERTVSVVAEKMTFGALDDLQAGEFNIVLGQDLAHRLRVRLGEKVTLIIPQASVTAAGILPRFKRFTVTGIFQIGMYEYDSAMAFIHLQDAAKLYSMGDNISGLRLKLDDMMMAPVISREIIQTLDLPRGVMVSDWTHQHVNFFQAIRTEKTVMFVILTLIVAVAAFNIVSTLVMTVTDKKSDIAILRTLGMSPGKIMRIFMIQGSVIGLLGTIMGICGGVALAQNVGVIVPAIESYFGVEFLPADVYYISDLPSELNWNDVIHIGVLSFVLSVVATIYPAWRAARTRPAEALRYE